MEKLFVFSSSSRKTNGDGRTRLLSATNPGDIQEAADLLRAGELVAIPTETVYGLGADASNEEALLKLYETKKRPQNHPFIIHVASFEDLPKWAKNIPLRAKKLADAFWPGPLTLQLQKADHVNNVVTGGLNTVALRCPAHPIFLKVLKAANISIAAPPANLQKTVSPTTADHVLDGLAGKIAAVLDAGTCEYGIESTVIDLTSQIPQILRHGPISQAMLEEVLGEAVLSPDAASDSIPGRVVHYHPKNPALRMSLEEIQRYVIITPKKWFAIVHHSPLHIKGDGRYVSILLPRKSREYASSFYAALHEADKDCFEIKGECEILIEEPPKTPEWDGVRDRLAKATTKP